MVLLYSVKSEMVYAVSFFSFVQYPNTSVRLQMEDAATCVFYRLEGDTNVPVPPISTWLLTIRPASPTAPPVRSAPLLNPTTSKCSLTVLQLFSHDQCFPHEGKQLYSHVLSSFEMYCRYLEN